MTREELVKVTLDAYYKAMGEAQKLEGAEKDKAIAALIAGMRANIEAIEREVPVNG
jgi:hypothetical protein